MQIATYKEAVDYLESFIGKFLYKIDREYLEHHDPLERMRVLLDLLGNPQDKFQSVLVGGTAGKGSTAYLISHILKTAGYKTGLTISPHLQKINERLQVNNMLISDEKFVERVNSIVQAIELMRTMKVGAPSYFEIIVAMAFLYFAQTKVDIAIVEVGLGGEFDATNTLYPLVAVLTNVSLDHTSILGGSVQKIAKTKAGIIKRIKDKGLINNSSLITHHLPVVTGIKQPSVIKIVEERCKGAGAEIFRLGKDFDFEIKKESLEGSVFDFCSCRSEAKPKNLDPSQASPDQADNLILSLLGRHQVENASLAIETVLQLKKFGFNVTDNHIGIALKTAFFPGRFEVVSLPCHKKETIQIILDGAHNPTKMKAFLSTLKRLYPKNPKVFVIGFKNDKDIKGMLRQILKVADVVIVTEFSAKTDMNKNASAEALSLKSQISNLKYDGDVFLEKNSEKALVKAASVSTMKQFNNSAIFVVTGSLYLVGEIRDFIVL